MLNLFSFRGYVIASANGSLQGLFSHRVASLHKQKTDAAVSGIIQSLQAFYFELQPFGSTIPLDP